MPCATCVVQGPWRYTDDGVLIGRCPVDFPVEVSGSGLELPPSGTRRRVLLDLLARNPRDGLHVADMCRDTRWPAHTVVGLLGELETAGLVHRTGSGRWWMKKEARV